MSVLVLGGDRIETLRKTITEMGIERVIHWTARGMKRGNVNKRPIPSDVKVVLLLTHFLNHNAMRYYRAQAKSKELEIIYADRNISQTKEGLTKIVNQLTQTAAADSGSMI